MSAYMRILKIFCKKNPGAKAIYGDDKGKEKLCVEVCYPDSAYLMFGKESAGIPEELLVQYQDYAVRIPMKEEIRL